MDSQLISLGRTSVCDIRDAKQPGLVLPIRTRDAPLLLTNLAGSMTAVVLSGTAEWVHFPVRLDRPHSGLLIPEPEVVVDFSTATDRSEFWETCGVLVLEQESLSLIAREAGHNFADPNPVPLWTRVEKGSGTQRVAFTHWGIAINDGDNRRLLFEHRHGATVRAVPLDH